MFNWISVSFRCLQSEQAVLYSRSYVVSFFIFNPQRFLIYMNKIILPALCALLLASCGNDTDKIGRASTVFHMLGKNDRIEVEGFDDPDVQGVACYISYAKKGGLKETVNLEEDASDASVSCVQTAEVIRYNEQAVVKDRKSVV